MWDKRRCWRSWYVSCPVNQLKTDNSREILFRWAHTGMFICKGRDRHKTQFCAFQLRTYGLCPLSCNIDDDHHITWATTCTHPLFVHVCTYYQDCHIFFHLVYVCFMFVSWFTKCHGCTNNTIAQYHDCTSIVFPYWNFVPYASISLHFICRLKPDRYVSWCTKYHGCANVAIAQMSRLYNFTMAQTYIPLIFVFPYVSRLIVWLRSKYSRFIWM